MISERQMRSAVTNALDEVLPATPWLESAVAENLHERLHRPSRPKRRLARPAMAAVLVALLVAAAILLTQLVAPGPVPGGRVGLTPAEQHQLAMLEERPLNFPTVAADPCPETPRSVVHPWSSPQDSALLPGSGPVYIPSYAAVQQSNPYLFDATYYTDPTARGLILIRAKDITTGSRIWFGGQWSAGAPDPQVVNFRSELALPSDRPVHDPMGAPGWGLWKVQAALAQPTYDCLVYQVDMATATQLIVVAS